MATYVEFFTNKLEYDIEKIIILNMFPNLNKSDVKALLNYIIKLLNIMSVCFNFDVDKNADYIRQLQRNDYRDIRLLINHLLPFIKTNADFSKIYSFNDIYVKKEKDMDINTGEPIYIYSNIQYNRCTRNNEVYEERQFNMNDLEQNYYLLIETIKSCANKLCVN